MEMLGFGILGGVLMCIIFFGAGVICGERDNQGQSGDDTDNSLHTDGRDRDRSGYHGCDQFYDAEEVVNGLQDLRMALSRKEKEYLDYACESVLIRHLLMERVKDMKERSDKDDNDD